MRHPACCGERCESAVLRWGFHRDLEASWVQFRHQLVCGPVGFAARALRHCAASTSARTDEARCGECYHALRRRRRLGLEVRECAVVEDAEARLEVAEDAAALLLEVAAVGHGVAEDARRSLLLSASIGRTCRRASRGEIQKLLRVHTDQPSRRLRAGRLVAPVRPEHPPTDPPPTNYPARAAALPPDTALAHCAAGCERSTNPSLQFRGRRATLLPFASRLHMPHL